MFGTKEWSVLPGVSGLPGAKCLWPAEVSQHLAALSPGTCQAFLTFTVFLLATCFCTGFNFPAALRQHPFPAGCAVEMQYLKIRFFIRKPFILMFSNLTFLSCDQAVFLWGWSLMWICIFLDMWWLFGCSRDEEHCQECCAHCAPMNSAKSPSELAANWGLLSVQWVLVMDKQ